LKPRFPSIVKFLLFGSPSSPLHFLYVKFSLCVFPPVFFRLATRVVLKLCRFLRRHLRQLVFCLPPSPQWRFSFYPSIICVSSLPSTPALLSLPRFFLFPTAVKPLSVLRQLFSPLSKTTHLFFSLPSFNVVPTHSFFFR